MKTKNKMLVMKRLVFTVLLLSSILFSGLTPGECRVVYNVMDVGEGGGAGEDILPQQKAFQHLYERMDKYQTAGTQRLIEAEAEPYTGGQEGTAWVYDNALAIIALVARGQPQDKARARLLCDALVWVQNNDPYFSDGRLRDAYWATNIVYNGKAAVKAPNTSAGNMAWVIIAWLRYYNYAGDADQAFRQQILSAAVRLGDFIENQLWAAAGPFPGYLIGYSGWEPNQFLDPYIKSTEHNADLYIAFKKLYEATAESFWLDRALKARAFIYSMRDPDESRFFVGTTPDNTINTAPLQQALDSNTMAILALNDASPINWLENNCRLVSDGYAGFDFNTDRDGVWFEGSAQMAQSYWTVGRYADNQIYKEQLRLAQTQAENGNGKGIISASRNYLTTGFGWYYFKTMAIASTCWFIFTELNLNPFS